MSTQLSPNIQQIIVNDPYARLLGIELVEIRPGYAKTSVTVTSNHTNFHGSTHGGLIFTLADYAFSAACNSHGQTAVALNVDISFLAATYPGDTLTAEARELSLKGPIGLYELTISHNGRLVAQCQAMAYRKRDRFAD